jgi:hypothetical protein
MRVQNWFVALLSTVTVACGPHVVSSGPGATDAGSPDAGLAEGYPPPPYGVSVNRIIQNFTFPGYFTAGSGVKVNTLPYSDKLDLQTVRAAVDANGKPYRYLLLDISAGWCPPCNQEAQELGMKGTRMSQIADWESRGGIFLTVLVEGYNESTHAPPVKDDIETWINQHNAQSSMAFDPNQNLITQGINPSAFPTNLVIDLKTMEIVSAWYGLDTTYQKWEAALNSQ